MTATSETANVVEKLKKDRPDIARYAYISGAWVWVSFDQKPAPETREYLKANGFKYSSKKKEWYNKCGVEPRRFRNGVHIDHRLMHGAVPIDPERDFTSPLASLFM